MPRSVSPIPDDEVLSGRKWAQQVLDPWDSLILTLDGGGIRGYSSLLILKRLMHEIAVWEEKLDKEQGSSSEPGRFKEQELLPCHYFDYMYGTSTGGLIATLLGRLRMSVPQCLEIYRQVGENLFGHRRSIIPLTTKYHHKPLEKAVRGIVRTNCPIDGPECDGEDWYPWTIDDTSDPPFPSQENNKHNGLCQSICLTATHNGRIDEAYLLRTYDHRYVDRPNWITPYNEGADKLRIWEVTRATSAAPFYFKILEADIAGEVRRFKDGGIRENNPSGAAWSEFVSLHGGDPDATPALLLSVGTGRPDVSQDGFAAAWPGPFGESKLVKKAAEKFAVFKNVLIKYTEGEDQHKAMVEMAAKGEHKWYKRLNVSEGLENMKLDSWQKGLWKNPVTGLEEVVHGGATLTNMEQATENYLLRELDNRFDTYAPPRTMLVQAAEILVRHRRARELTNSERWNNHMGRHLAASQQSTES
ncbi:hypothetical protein W97_07428 [Coniosporium apollinis CBS 100218]|uniref:PNPLA domain-containing protein n=1 Tax=Coniosporium apollinis (strain CBS 100218) TaxID=1168221 RepID=R7Z1X2_CONA1|nr:uncharacterized protein W97_07428 [Coniosporium apollinis CBS 100218]EON67931.1 hypothetical protein W97_07428 [Coniosporium apollinis CBS 100218]